MKTKAIYLLLFLLALNPSSKGQDFTTFVNMADAFFVSNVQQNNVAYQVIQKERKSLEVLVQQIAKIDVQGLSDLEQKAFYINAYNLLVIKKVIDFYPIASTYEIMDFWDKADIVVSGKTYSLQNFKLAILEQFLDPRLYFVLSDASNSGAPIIQNAYIPIRLEEQIESRCIEIFNSSRFVLYNQAEQEVTISGIFKQYPKDFQVDIWGFLNSYRVQKIDSLVRILYDNYDGRLNDLYGGFSIKTHKKTKNITYTPLNLTGTLAKGVLELSIYNSVFALEMGTGNTGLRNSFLSSFISANYGINGSADVGVLMILRSSRVNDYYENSPFKVFEFERSLPNSNSRSNLYSDWAFSHLGFQVRFAPFKKLNLVFEQGILLPMKGLPKDNAVDENIYIISQVQFTHMFNSKWHLFLALGFWEGISVGQTFRFSPPSLKCYLSYYVTPRFAAFVTTMYFWEWGAGVKFMLTPKFELQAMYSYFLPIPTLLEFLSPATSSAMTYNLGLRYRF